MNKGYHIKKSNQRPHYFTLCNLIFLTGLVIVPTISGQAVEKPEQKSILIVLEDSYLEHAVAAILSDSLTARGFSIKRIGANDLTHENPRRYTASIIFGALKGDRVDDPVIRRYIGRRTNPLSNIMICSVYGQSYIQGSPMIKTDAVAAATATLNPEAISQRILRNFP